MKTSKKSLVTLSLVAALAGSMFIVSCSDRDALKGQVLELPSQPFNYTTVTKANGDEIDLTFRIKDESAQVFSDHTATLGRVLFYDRIMSINNTVSCGSCHEQSLAFADGKALSTGFANKKTERNAMAILNPVDNNNMFWDSRSASPMALSLEPVFNHIEMGMESDEMLVSKISTAPYYTELFQNAYGSAEVSKEKIALALASFINSMFSEDSKFDRGVDNDFADFSPIEKMGKDLFHSDRLMCASCHAGDNFVAPDGPGDPYGGGSGGFGNDFGIDERFNSHIIEMEDNGPRGTANIGLDLVYEDEGRRSGNFKIPSLRNIELTGPYMHDGRFASLEEVVDHYSTGIQMHPDLDKKFVKNGQAKKLNITETEKIALIAFLKTLTDESYTEDPKFSDPFH